MKNYFSLIKFSHTIFALPFALIGFFIGLKATGETFELRILLLVLLCMIFARSAAMAFNRYADKEIDARNPRTLSREIPSGIIKPGSALIFVILNGILFIATTWFINPICFYLSPVALLIILGYSYSKRFTFLCHFILGLGLSLAPIGSYLAVTGQFDAIPVFYGLAVLLWVSGFDIIYALQDREFDLYLDLKSVPVWMGTKNALLLSSVLHVFCGLFILAASWQLQVRYEIFNWMTWAGTAIFLVLLFYQHTLVKHNDLKRVNLAFFTTNGFASLILGLFVILDFWF